MENVLNVIKQPEPNISPDLNSMSKAQTAVFQQEKPKREIKRPHVGIIDVPTISKTPITDTLEIKKQENPHIKYKLSTGKNAKFSIKEIESVIISACGLLALFNFKKKK